MRYLLDSNTCSHIHRGTPAVAIRLASLTRPAALYLSVVVQGELLYGAYHAPRAMRAKLLRGIRRVLGRVADVLPLTPAVAERYGHIKAELAARGTLIPSNDVWIAATALEEDLILVSDDAHFERVPGLTVENWVR